jgi:hypothetical protein
MCPARLRQGDSRAVLFKRGPGGKGLVPTAVTRDHKPNLPSETKRILLAGGCPHGHSRRALGRSTGRGAWGCGGAVWGCAPAAAVLLSLRALPQLAIVFVVMVKCAWLTRVAAAFVT